MDDEIFKKLKAFIINQQWEYDFPLLRTTNVEKELKITGDDAVDFLIAYGKKFNVDISHFMAADYFDGEGDKILPLIYRFFMNNQKSAKRVLTIGDLEKGILAGCLDENVINS